MPLLSKSGVATIAVATGLVLTAGTSGAVAGAVITGKQIKNNTVTTKDVKNNNLGGIDIADGSVDTAELSGTVRAGLGDLTISGVVSPAGVVKVLRAPAGVGVTVLKDIGGNEGANCLTVTGGPVPVGPASAVLIATPDYAFDSTNVGDNQAIVEVSSKVGETGCPDGFRLQTLKRIAGTNSLSNDQGFLFQIN
jgi:hypothetical protein